MSIRPIETVYNGVRYRSRLEARWALFFDLLCVRHHYEAEAFALPSGNYLPDFYLPSSGGHFGNLCGESPDCYLEVKPFDTQDSRFCEFAIATTKPLIVVFGPPHRDLNAVCVLYDGAVGAAFRESRQGWAWDGRGAAGDFVFDTIAMRDEDSVLVSSLLSGTFAAVRAHRFWG
jgi:hypothetical protein